MSKRTIVGLAGNLQRPSKTRLLVDFIVQEAAAEAEGRGTTFDLEDFGPALARARQLSDLGADELAIVDALLTADVLVIGSRPTREAIPASSSI